MPQKQSTQSHCCLVDNNLDKLFSASFKIIEPLRVELTTMFQIDPGRPPGEFIPLENQVPNQEIDGPRAMLPLVPVREQQDHDVRQHAGLGHGQHDDMELENMLPLQQMFNLDNNDDMLEDGNARP